MLFAVAKAVMKLKTALMAPRIEPTPALYKTKGVRKKIRWSLVIAFKGKKSKMIGAKSLPMVQVERILGPEICKLSGLRS